MSKTAWDSCVLLLKSKAYGDPILVVKPAGGSCMLCFFNLHLMYGSYYDMVPVLLIPWLRPVDDMDDYCDDKYNWWLYWQCGEGWQPWWPLVKILWWPKWCLKMTLTTQMMTGDSLVDTFDELVMTLKKMMMTSDDIWWPQLMTFIANIKSGMSCSSGTETDFSPNAGSGILTSPNWHCACLGHPVPELGNPVPKLSKSFRLTLRLSLTPIVQCQCVDMSIPVLA